MSEKWVVISGDFFEGLLQVVGTFDSEDEAEEYADAHNMYHGTKAVIKLHPAPERQDDG